MEDPMDIYLMTCRFCGYRNSVTYPPGRDCVIADESGWLLTCERCEQISAQRNSGASHWQSFWGPA